VGSALSAALLLANTHPGHTLSDVRGFRVALFVAAGLGVATALISYVLPGRALDRSPQLSSGAREEIQQVMIEEAQLAATGFMVTEALNPFEQEGEPLSSAHTARDDPACRLAQTQSGPTVRSFHRRRR
jgi:hypothetical protein